MPGPPTVSVLPDPTDTVPAVEKLPTVVKLALPVSVKPPVAALVARFARPLPLVVVLTICAAGPLRVILAAFVTILAPLNSSVPAISYVPPVSVEVADLKLVRPRLASKVLPVNTDRVPLLLKVPTVVKSAPPSSVKLLFDALTAKFARPLPLVVEFTISAAGPESVMLAALVTMFAPANASLPSTSYVPPVSVVPEKLVSDAAGATVNALPAPTVSTPLFVKFPAVVKSYPPSTLNPPVAEFTAKLARPLPLVVELTICAPVPVSAMLAALVTMLAPVNSRVPVTS